jgi:hypothetical protein
MAWISGHSVAQARAAPLAIIGALGRREVLLWLAFTLFANQVLSLQAESHETLPAIAQALLSRSVIYYLAWYTVVTLLLAGPADRPASRLDLAIALGVASLNLVPVLSSAWLATTAAGLLLLISRPRDHKITAVAAVLLALAFNGYWGPKLFSVFGYYILRADAALVGSILAATQPGMGWHDTVVGTAGGHSVLIFNPCSSFHNISLGLLCWIAVTKLVRTSWVRSDAAVAAAVCAAMILFNATRLYLMALSPEHYAYWHGGTGEHMVAWASTLTVLSISLWGAVRVGK